MTFHDDIITQAFTTVAAADAARLQAAASRLEIFGSSHDGCRLPFSPMFDY